jgi:predicted O-methyltransferase YrrM
MRRIPWHRLPSPVRHHALTQAHGARATVFGQTMEERDAQALQMLAPLPGPFLPWTSYALRPEAILTFLNAIVLLNAAQIIECGSGLSTVYVARLFAQQGGGHLHTIEEDPEWGKRVLEQLRREGIDEHVTMHVVPLGPDEWYRQEDLEPLRSTPIDVLLVDGPSNRPRGRALDTFAGSLAADYVVILDDIWKSSVEQDLRSWEKRLGVRGKRQYRQGGVGVLQPAGSRLDITY